MSNKKGCVGEVLGFVRDQVRQQVFKAPHHRNVDELITDIGADIQVDIHRWIPNPQGLETPEYYQPWQLHFKTAKPLDDLLTKAGRDLIHNVSFMAGAQPAALTYYAICNPGTFTPVDTDTSLNTEITTPSGLARHVCTGSVDGVTESFTHTASGNTTVVVCGFKNNSAGAITGIKGYGNFNAAGPPVAGTLGTESSFTTLDLQINDILKLTVTLTLG